MRTFLPLILLLALSAAATQNIAEPSKALGSPNAPIRLEVFSDYQCPSCKALYEGTLRPLMSEYVSKGKVYLVHREFPLPMHQYARPAACLATAAARMNRYEEVCAALFRTQQSWSGNGKIDEALRGVLSPAELKKMVALASDPQVVAQVQKDVDLGVRANIRSTPTMMLVHKQRTYPIASAVSYPIFKRFLDDLLSK